jgi:hypothetical protein
MRRESIILILILCLTTIPITATQKVPLKDMYKPFRIRVCQDKIYIGQEATIHIFSAKDYKPIKKFGKKGEGPGEFKLLPERSPEMDVQSNLLLATSMGKLSLYSKDGQLIKEVKLTSNRSQLFRRLGEKFIGEGFLIRDNIIYQSVDMYNSHLLKTKEIHKHPFYIQRNQKYNPIERGIYLPNFYIYKQKIYVGGAIGQGKFHIFDKNGEALYTLSPSFERVPFTARDKQGWIDSYMLNDAYKAEYERRKHRFLYPDYFPLWQNFVVADGFIYVQSYKRDEKDQGNEFYILDLQGKLLKKLWLPLAEGMDFNPSPYIIGNHKLYQLVEDSDTEEWALHISEIE